MREQGSHSDTQLQGRPPFILVFPPSRITRITQRIRCVNQRLNRRLQRVSSDASAPHLGAMSAGPACTPTSTPTCIPAHVGNTVLSAVTAGWQSGPGCN